MVTKGSGVRKCTSWIESFVKHTDNLESAEIYRRWSAISVIAATLECKVWITTSAPLYPNLYVFLIGHPAVGKTRTIAAASKFILELPEPHLAPTSMTMASLTDCLVESKRFIQRLPKEPLEYNSMFIMADELSAFMHKWEEDIVGGLTTFYDVETLPYGQHRRGKDIRIKIKKPQLNILVGSTPSNLVRFMPDVAWDQGLTSRVIMVFSDERPMGDIFADTARRLPADMVTDLKVINHLCGQFTYEDGYKTAVNNWRALGQQPSPNHPKLTHYNSRRLTHLLKLSMVSAVDRGNKLHLTTTDFNRAMGWLHQAEDFMPDIFKAGAVGADSRAIDEIHHYIIASDRGKGVSETIIINFARGLIPIHSVGRVIQVLSDAGLIRAIGMDKLGVKYYKPIFGKPDLKVVSEREEGQQ